MRAVKFFSQEEKERLQAAIAEAEMNTSGEIRLHVDNSCKIDVLDCAAHWFKKLGMHKTELRNGVLFYMAIKEQKFAIIGDAGIHQKTPENFWDDIKETVLEHFREDRFTEGLEKGIRMAGEQLKTHFPHQADDINELSDEISFGG